MTEQDPVCAHREGSVPQGVVLDPGWWRQEVGVRGTEVVQCRGGEGRWHWLWRVL